ncbi:MAG: transcription elongation factor GreA [Candidatus Cloacimonetes bacterium]|nr:transcription elongation factor GreA [Candidatus Cloacimonadota bacterium]MBL7085506.1 transcription elongation factor GreA [Candidatus Cloacimonadota bacterium]
MTQEYISKEGLEKLKMKLQHLIQKERPAVIKQIALARQFGDLSENAEYHAAKEKQRFIETDISRFQQKIAKLKVINTDIINKNEVRFGAKVKLLDLNRKKIVIYKIVGEDETRKEDNISPVRDKSLNGVRKISCNAPIAKALLGKKLNDEIEVKAPAGIIKYRINGLKY